MKIKQIFARQILDSRGLPTVEVDLRTDNHSVRASVPSGASTGSHEAHEKRDNNIFYHGKSVMSAVDAVNNQIAPALIGYQAWDQRAIDNLMTEIDGTANKSNLGANAILAVSIAAAKAAAQEQDLPLYSQIQQIAGLDTSTSLPQICFNIYNGGSHANNSSKVQEFMISIENRAIADQLRFASETFHSLKNMRAKSNLSTTVGDEGGFAGGITNVEAVLDSIMQSADQSGYKEQIKFALDVAANEIYDQESDNYQINPDEFMSAGELTSYYASLIDKYPIFSIEDPLHEDSWDQWTDLTSKLGNKTMIVGDDHYVTNKSLLQKGIDCSSANAILIKPNQIGSLSETIDTVLLAKENDFKTMASHRSGETNDNWISHIAVGLGCDYIKAGSVSRGERLAKYNELLRIEESL